MEATALHILDDATVAAYLRDGISPIITRSGDAPGRRATPPTAGATAGLAVALAVAGPSFVHPGISLTALEARIDRGVGMLLRPPARLFIGAGLDPALARQMPVRLDLAGGAPMGGAFIPAHLVPELESLIERRLARFLRRLADAEMDPVATLGLLLDACAVARARGCGLYESLDVIVADAPASWPPGGVRLADRKRLDPVLRRRLEEAAKPPKPVKRPGLVARMLGRGSAVTPNGHAGADAWPGDAVDPGRDDH
ncbi:MAG: hypothetical protein M3462_12695 [Chloroflexota bacterium]|nr:hypothetical protein [Chloroflexota bacterium]